MKHSNPFHPVLRILLLFLAMVGTAGLGIYWFTLRVQQADWRLFAVGLLLSVVLGWWPWISTATGLVLASVVFFAGPEPDLRLQIAGEILCFWILGLGWGILARMQLHASPPSEDFDPPWSASSPVANSIVMPLKADPSAFQPRRLMDGADEEPRRQEPPAPKSSTPPLDLGWTPILIPVEPIPLVPLPLPSLEGLPPSAFPPPPPPPKPLPRPSAAPMLGEYGGESVYMGSLPGPSQVESAVKDSTHPFLQTVAGPQGSSLPPKSSSPGVGSRFAIPDEPSVVPAIEFPTMELPVNTLLRPPQPRSAWSPPSGSGPPSSGEPISTSGDSGGEGQGVRRSSEFLRPETTPGASFEHVLEWYNQFSWSPWSAQELERLYYRPGVMVGWETQALKDLSAVWKIWHEGCTPVHWAPGQIGLKSLEGFLRCEVLGVLRQQGFPDLHVLSRADDSEAWLAVYREVRGRMRGGEATIRRVDSGEALVDLETGLVGRPDRLAEIRGENDVVALVTPFSVTESLNWTTVYALAQYRLAHSLDVALSGTPVVVNLPLPIWDERKQCRLVTVDDLVSEQRRLDVALERFRRVLAGQTSPHPQTHSNTCSGCGWRHACPNYQGTRPRLDLSNPPPQIAASLR